MHQEIMTALLKQTKTTSRLTPPQNMIKLLNKIISPIILRHLTKLSIYLQYISPLTKNIIQYNNINKTLTKIDKTNLL
jgi:hypothetical protein